MYTKNPQTIIMDFPQAITLYVAMVTDKSVCKQLETKMLFRVCCFGSLECVLSAVLVGS